MILISWGLISLLRSLFSSPVVSISTLPEPPLVSYESDIIEVLPYRDRYSKIVWLDAGHGGIDIGTYVTHGNSRIYEKDIALDIVLKAYGLFQQSNSNIKVFLTRRGDYHVSLSRRTNLWNDTEYMIAKADLVVSVHVDYYDGETAQTVSGIQVNYYENYENPMGNTGRVDITSAQFAQILQSHLVNETGARNRYIRGDRGFNIPENSTMPAVLIETGFMSNNEELAKLLTEEYRMSIARAMYNGIVEAFTDRSPY